MSDEAQKVGVQNMIHPTVHASGRNQCRVKNLPKVFHRGLQLALKPSVGPKKEHLGDPSIFERLLPPCKCPSDASRERGPCSLRTVPKIFEIFGGDLAAGTIRQHVMQIYGSCGENYQYSRKLPRRMEQFRHESRKLRKRDRIRREKVDEEMRRFEELRNRPYLTTVEIYIVELVSNSSVVPKELVESELPHEFRDTDWTCFLTR
ncbi:unnamed protein product [Strongylus vulgaris]|uniref:Uncharacterized protein n=1 Tax=Strongylus vulgaris TaxID=40348 RepID=A0A3P7IW82_STRVU|nr:unnamed protein product [Strongylus vulgaris]